MNWTKVFNTFDPWKPLSGKKLETWFVTREDSPLRRLESSLQPDKVEQKVLLVGQRGCGKTSELLKLVSLMQDEYFTVYVDLFASLDLNASSLLELLFCIGGAVYKVAREDDKVHPPERLWKELVSSQSTLIREQTRRSEFELNPTAILSTLVCAAGAVYPPLAAAGKAVEGVRFGFGIGRKEIERLEVPPILREVIARVNAIIGEVEERAGQPVLLVADGLDKITDFKQAALLFARSWALTAIGCRALYTVPVALYYSTQFHGEVQNFFASEELPNVRLYPRGEREKRHEPGFETMRSLVEKRLTSAGLTLEQTFDPQALDELVRMSGGVMRDMVSLVRYAALKAEEDGADRISPAIAQWAIAKLRREMQAALFEDHYRALSEIARSEGLIDRDDPAQMELVRDGYVVSYHDGFWRDIHPIIWPLLEEYTSRTVSPRRGQPDP